MFQNDRADPSRLKGMPTGYQSLQQYRTSVEAGLDGLVWSIALSAATVLRMGDFHRDLNVRLAAVIAVAVLVQWGVGFATRLYRVHWQVGSFEQLRALAITVCMATLAATVFDVARPDHIVSYGAVIAGGFMALALAGGVRSAWRLNWERRLKPATGARRAVVFGAGKGGTSLINMMATHPDTPYVPVALLDDDPAKRRQRIRHLTVSGGREQLAQVAARHDADTVIIAIPSATSTLIRDIADLAGSARLEIRVLPPPSEFLFSPVQPSDIRPVTPADLLGRKVVDTRMEEVTGYLRGRRVLVTGAGGSIGSELCRQIHRFEPATLVMLDRDEAGLHAVQLSLEGRALLDDRSLVLCNIRNADALDAVFSEHKPEVVFHAAALKHLPLLEMWPTEAVDTNVLGTQNVLEAAVAHRVRRFVNISTDKAANPISVLGYTKRIAERLTAAAGTTADGSFLSVRFGNVLGSRGSVLITFENQISNGGPVTVTHPDVCRYFMTVEEAVQLVIQAGAMGNNGEVLILDMGEPVNIADVARRLVMASGKNIEIVYTGIRAGEKLAEELLGPGEHPRCHSHPLIAHVDVPPLFPEALHTFMGEKEPDALKKLLLESSMSSPLNGLAGEVAVTEADSRAEEASRSGGPKIS